MMMKISYKFFRLQLKYPFNISGFSRTFTPVLLLEINYHGYTGFGEASMVPYLGENEQTASAFLEKIDWGKFSYPFNFSEISAYLDNVSAGNPAVKASVDIAIHDLTGKIEDKPCFELFGSNQSTMPLSSVTIGIDEPEIIIKKVMEASFARVLKVKLGSQDDKRLIETIRSVTNVPLYADANQGWSDKAEAVEILHWLKEKDVLIVEQPMAKNDLDGNAWVTERSPIPILADEACQRLADIEKIKGAYHGINIKLMKSSGMFEALKMIIRARELNLKVLIGCMSETSIATLAGAALAPLCDWADLDGPFLTDNNPYKNPAFESGKWILPERPGLGVEV